MRMETSYRVYSVAVLRYDTTLPLTIIILRNMDIPKLSERHETCGGRDVYVRQPVIWLDETRDSSVFAMERNIDGMPCGSSPHM